MPGRLAGVCLYSKTKYFFTQFLMFLNRIRAEQDNGLTVSESGLKSLLCLCFKRIKIIVSYCFTVI